MRAYPMLLLRFTAALAGVLAGLPVLAQGAAQITIAQATYGSNCTPKFDATAHMARTCNGKAECLYPVLPDLFRDPKQEPACSMDFQVEFTCGSGPRQRSSIEGPSHSRFVQLKCPVPTQAAAAPTLPTPQQRAALIVQLGQAARLPNDVRALQGDASKVVHAWTEVKGKPTSAQDAAITSAMNHLAVTNVNICAAVSFLDATNPEQKKLIDAANKTVTDVSNSIADARTTALMVGLSAGGGKDPNLVYSEAISDIRNHKVFLERIRGAVLKESLDLINQRRAEACGGGDVPRIRKALLDLDTSRQETIDSRDRAKERASRREVASRGAEAGPTLRDLEWLVTYRGHPKGRLGAFTDLVPIGQINGINIALCRAKVGNDWLPGWAYIGRGNDRDSCLVVDATTSAHNVEEYDVLAQPKGVPAGISWQRIITKREKGKTYPPGIPDKVPPNAVGVGRLANGSIPILCRVAHGVGRIVAPYLDNCMIKPNPDTINISGNFDFEVLIDAQKR